VFRTKRHDTGISPELVLTPPEGVTWDLSENGLTARLIGRLNTSPTAKINAPVVVTGPWRVRYDPVPADVDTIGIYDVEVEVTRGNGKKVTFPTADPGEAGSLTWRIGTDLDNL
jgi:hypothetical protein